MMTMMIIRLMWSTLSWPFILGLLGFGVELPVRVLSIREINMFENYPYTKKKKKKDALKKLLHKKVNMNAQ